MNILRTKLFAGIGVILLIAAGWLLYIKLEGEKPLISIKDSPSFIRASHQMTVRISDNKSGIKSARITLAKGDKDIILYEKSFPAINFIMGGVLYDKDINILIEPAKLKLKNGLARLIIEVKDYSWRNWLGGNTAIMEKSVMIDTRPPVIDVLTTQHNINRGGAGLVIYNLSEPCQKSGVMVGDTFFPGYKSDFKGKKNKNTYMSFIALAYKKGPDTKIYVTATDLAGNISKAGFYYHIRNKKFKKDIIRISDGFLNMKMPEFEGQIPDGKKPPLKKFLYINRVLRVANTKKIKKITEKSENTMLWKGTFLRLPNSARRAGFADHREYQYKGKIIDRQVHMGVDLASVSHAKVPAGNNGKVIFTGYIGIYGNTIILDHGMGLFSTYSHLSKIGVKQGDMVKKGEIIGKTGLTGLAGGDHLHYGMLVHGVFINPVEWWDRNWIKNNIRGKIESVSKDGS